MKKVLLLLMFVSFSVFPQSAESLKASTKKIFQANYLLDFDGIALLSYPKIIETIGADNIYDKLEQHYEIDEYRLRYQLETVPFKYGEIKKIEGRSFCVITCRNPMRYTFGKKLSKEAAAKKTQDLMDINKTKEVTFEPARNSFNVKRTTTFVAVSDATTNGQWRFFNFDNAFQQDVFNSIFIESTKKELGL
jgi:hypothetical protein